MVRCDIIYLRDYMHSGMKAERKAAVRAVIQRITECSKDAIKAMKECAKALIQRVKEYVRGKLNQSIERPRSTVQMVFFVMVQVVFIVAVLFVVWWLPNANVESARWALSAQAPASGSILGLVIAAMIFRWGVITNQEREIQGKTGAYFVELANANAGPRGERFAVDVAYDEYLSLMNRERERGGKKVKEALRVLGRFWVIRKLSIGYTWAVDTTISRELRRGQLEELSRVSKVSKESAVNMWHSYFRNPGRFVLDMFEALQFVSRTLAISRKCGKMDVEGGVVEWSPIEEYRVLEKVVGFMRKGDTWLIANEAVRWRTAIRFPFYLACMSLFTATILAICVLSGVGGVDPLLGGAEFIRFWVGASVLLCIFGVYFCVMLVLVVLQ
jgi:hypothetical protein